MRTVSEEFVQELIDFAPDAKVAELGFTQLQLEGCVAAFNMLARNRAAYIADEVGMGKTYVALGVMALFRYLDPEARIVVIAPRENIQLKWIKELRNFVRVNWKIVGNRVKSIHGEPAWEPVYCGSLVDFLHEIAVNPDRDFFLRMTSFSMALKRKTARRRLRQSLRELAPWLQYEGLSARSPDGFRDGFGTAVNALVPDIDLLVVDEGHNFKHGFGPRASTRNRILGLTLGRPHEEFEVPSWYRHHVGHLLLLSATPFEDDYGAVQRQLDVFGMGDIPLHGPRGNGVARASVLSDLERPIDERRDVLGRVLIRRVSGLRIGGTLHTKNMYRREWRGGGFRQHDDPMRIQDPRQRLIVALMQKKIAEVLRDPRFNNRFQIGMLSSFESFLQTVASSAKRETVAEEETELDAASLFDGQQEATEQERRGIDTDAVARIAESYRERFGDALPHPKLDAAAQALAPAFETGEKALVFVRRVRTVVELAGKLDAAFDRWIRARLERALPELRHELARLFDRYERERSRRADEVFEERPIDADESDPEELGERRSDLSDLEDEGGAETFFAWFFRGDGPRGVLSGAAFHRNRLASTSSAYATLFEDDYVSWLLGRPADVLGALSEAVSVARPELVAALRRRAWAHFRTRSQQKEGYPRLYVYQAYQAVALEWLEHAGGKLGESAAVVVKERFPETAAGEEEPPAGFPGPEQGIGATTVITELVKRPRLREQIWPDEPRADFRDHFRRREQRRELLSALARLGASYIDLYTLAIRRVGSFEPRREVEREAPAEQLARDFLDLLEDQREIGGFGSWYELSHAAEAFDVLLSVNFPQVPSRTLKELAGVYASVLRRQTPVGRMAGGVNKSLVAQFRMPGFPLVLISTDVLQEGEDLHTFCRRIVHYGITWTPSAMEQRTGRVDRIGGLVQRRLDGRAEPPEEDEWIQAYYPHLQDTVEVLQMRRVFARMNRFLRLIHRTEGSEEETDSRIDAQRELLEEIADVQPVKEPLESAFPVDRAWLGGALGKADVHQSDATEQMRHVEGLWHEAVVRLRIEEHRSGSRFALEGTMPFRGLDQRFGVELRSQAAGDAVLLRCRSDVGEFDLRDDSIADLIHDAELALGGVRVCLRPDPKKHVEEVTVENDILVDVDATRTPDLESLILRTTRAAHELTLVLAEDERIDEIRSPVGRLDRAPDLEDRLGGLARRHDLPWEMVEGAVSVRLLRGGRQHRIQLRSREDRYVLRAPVTGRAGYARTRSEVRALSYRSWRWNSHKELVDFCVDRRGRLYGAIEQPIASAHDRELILYVNSLARECDHAEYVLTGEDVR